jgi:protein-S-isoprenylcysteine O-methyltransferase Ste14
MSRTDHITIVVLALVGVVGVAAVEVLTLVEVQEWIKFAVMVVTFVVILSGTYWFVLTQGDRGDDQGH